MDAISRRSELKVAAQPFVPVFGPGRKLPAALTRIMSPALLPAPAVPLPPSFIPKHFNSSWSLYYMDQRDTASGAFEPTEIAQIPSIESFWRVFNNVPKPSELPVNATLYLFRTNVAPKWEDPKNRNGGCFTWWTNDFFEGQLSGQLDKRWERVCCMCLGESWSEPLRAHVMGVVVKLRERAHSIQLWVGTKLDEDPKDLVHEFGPSLEYRPHENAKQRAQAAKPSTKKKRK